MISELAKVGIPGLDAVLAGGLPQNRMYLIQGDPGVGKTTLALQFLLEGVKQGEKCLYITLSETEAEVRSVALSHGWDISQLNIYELSASAQRLQSEPESTLFVSSEIELHEATKTLIAEVERVKPTRVVFDSLSELRLLAQDALRYRRQILSLKEYFAGQKCTVLMLDGLSIDLPLESLAHGVISLHLVTPEYGSDRRRLRVVKLRGVKFVGGYHDYSIERGGLVVFPRLVAADHYLKFAPGVLPSGVPALDQLLGGGLDRGTSTLLLGPAGAGKSAIATHYALAAAERGENVVMFHFDEHLATMTARSLGMGMGITRHLEAGRIAVQQIDPAEMSPGEFVKLVQRHVEERKARVVVIDSLNGYMNAMPEERFLTIQMHELLTYLSQQGVATFLVVAQHGMVGPMATPVDVSYLADTVLLLRYFESGGAVLKALSVMKKRGGMHENTIRQLSFGPQGVVVGEPMKGFHGILTGVPSYIGETGVLAQDDQSSGQ